MKYSTLGSSNLSVSRVCLGTMTWGVQNSQIDADQQIAYALDHGINFIDTAEIYAIPPSPETYGKTEIIIGDWLARHKSQRDDIVLASKISGAGVSWIRDGGAITAEAVISAVDNSLKRLQTDYLDLYQLHWPNRNSPHFGKHFPNVIDIEGVDSQKHTDQMLEILQALASCVQAGKIKHCGLSDDTPWGINTYLKLSEQYDLPKMVSIQNEFNLLHSKDWPYLIENCHHENVAYLPWSPLAGGILSGKYLNGERPEGSRWTLSQRNGLFRDSKNVHFAVEKYAEIARKYGYTPAQLALAWCDQVQGVTSTIIGATSIEQLREDIDAFNKPLTSEVIAEINAVIQEYPAPF